MDKAFLQFKIIIEMNAILGIKDEMAALTHFLFTKGKIPA